MHSSRCRQLRSRPSPLSALDVVGVVIIVVVVTRHFVVVNIVVCGGGCEPLPSPAAMYVHFVLAKAKKHVFDKSFADD